MTGCWSKHTLDPSENQTIYKGAVPEHFTKTKVEKGKHS